MDQRHPETELTAYVRGELTERTREAVSRHLSGCAECRETVSAFRSLFEALARAPEPPAIQWGRYRAEIRARLESESGRRRWAWWRHPLPLAASAGVATALLVVALLMSSPRQELPVRLAAENLNGFEEVVLGTRLDLLQQYPVVERLELLEDLDVIRQLDGLTGSREG